jgi:hypothetical protein
MVDLEFAAGAVMLHNLLHRVHPPRVVSVGSRKALSICDIQKLTAHSIPSDISVTIASISVSAVTAVAK